MVLWCMFVSHSFGDLLARRMVELFDADRSEWSRRGWAMGTLGLLRELLNAAGPNTPVSVRQDALAATRKRLDQGGRDPALSDQRCGLLLEALPKSKDLERFANGNQKWEVLSYEVSRLQDEYLGLWKSLLARRTRISRRVRRTRALKQRRS